jgi:hypothetical protein
LSLKANGLNVYKYIYNIHPGILSITGAFCKWEEDSGRKNNENILNCRWVPFARSKLAEFNFKGAVA